MKKFYAFLGNTILVPLCVVIFIAPWVGARAQMPDETCRDRAIFLKDLEAVEKAALSIDISVESVPPADAEYIRKETRAALDQKNSRRYSLVAASRYYTASEFHNDMKIALDNIAAARSASTLKQSATYLSVVIARLGDANSSLYNYIDLDAKRSAPVLSKDDNGGLFFSMPVLRHSALRLLQCAVGSI